MMHDGDEFAHVQRSFRCERVSVDSVDHRSLAEGIKRVSEGIDGNHGVVRRRLFAE